MNQHDYLRDIVRNALRMFMNQDEMPKDAPGWIDIAVMSETDVLKMREFAKGQREAALHEIERFMQHVHNVSPWRAYGELMNAYGRLEEFADEVLASWDGSRFAWDHHVETVIEWLGLLAGLDLALAERALKHLYELACDDKEFLRHLLASRKPHAVKRLSELDGKQHSLRAYVEVFDTLRSTPSKYL